MMLIVSTLTNHMSHATSGTSVLRFESSTIDQAMLTLETELAWKHVIQYLLLV